LEGAAVDQAVFTIQLPIPNRISLLAGFLGLGRPTALTVPALSLQLPKRSRSDSTSPVNAAIRGREFESRHPGHSLRPFIRIGKNFHDPLSAHALP